MSEFPENASFASTNSYLPDKLFDRNNFDYRAKRMEFQGEE